MVVPSWRDSFEKKLSKAQRSKRVRKFWKYWRLVLSDGGFDYNTVFHQMTEAEVDDANIALDMHIKAMNEALKKK